MLALLGQHIGSVTKPLVKSTPLETSRLPTVLSVQRVLYSWSSVTMSRTFGFVGGDGVDVIDGVDGANAAPDTSASSVARILRARIGASGRTRRPTLSSRRGTVNGVCRGAAARVDLPEPSLHLGEPTLRSLELRHVPEVREHAELEARIPLRDGLRERERNEAVARSVERPR